MTDTLTDEIERLKAELAGSQDALAEKLEDNHRLRAEVERLKAELATTRRLK